MNHAFIDEHSHIDSLITRLDPRIKIISLIAIILFVAFTKSGSWAGFAMYGLLSLLLIVLSRIPVRFIIKRMLVILPFVLMTSIFIPFVGKQDSAVLVIGSLQTGITKDGLELFQAVMVKSTLCILCTILFLSSTPFPDLLKAMEKLKFPRLVTMILSFMYRYIFVIQDEAMRMRQARKARAIGGSSWFHMKALAGMAAILFLRSFERAEMVYLAMCSRGYEGTIRQTEHHLKIKSGDLLFLIAVLACLAQIRFFIN